jgi:signal transduction histidine kinase
MFFVALAVVAIYVIQPSINNMEEIIGNQALNQTINVINYDLSQLKANAISYSAWDDTYKFVQDGNQAYIDINYVDSTFEELNLNLLVIVDNNSRMLYCQSFDLNNSVKVETSTSTKEVLKSNDALWKFSSADANISGIMLIDNQPMLVVTTPILKSTYTGPILGGMLFGRYLDSVQISQLQTVTGYNFSIYQKSTFEQSNSKILELLLSKQQNVVIKEDSPTTMSEYAIINDINSNGLFVMQVSQNRIVYQQGVWVEYVFLAAAILLTITLALSIAFLLEIGIVKPLTKLSSQIKTMSIDLERPKPKSKFQTDEIEILAESARYGINKKFEAMNEVSRMVAHDLRNPLAGIRNANFLIKKKYGNEIGEQGKAMSKVIDDCLAYSDKIVQDLLDYSAEIKLQKVNVTPKKIVADALTTLNVPQNVEVTNLLNDDFLITVDNGKIVRVFSNLIKNAIDAMPNGGRLTITSKEINKNAVIEITDTGEGMSEETIKKLWTPFFTTKPKGMGIGLSICKRIIEAHSGRIEVKSVIRKGTTFTVFLPLTS